MKWASLVVDRILAEIINYSFKKHALIPTRTNFFCDINGLMKNFVKAMDPEGQAFKYFRETYPRLSDARIKAPKFFNW